MKYLFWMWAVPLTMFWGWFGLSYNDMNFGTQFLSRDMHDLVFAIYSNVLNLSYDQIVSGAVKACIFDTFLVAGIIAFRRRKKIKAWWNERNSPINTGELNQSLIFPAE